MAHGVRKSDESKDYSEVLFRLVSTELLEGDFTLVPIPSIKRKIDESKNYSEVRSCNCCRACE
jgi:hypothetical protein